MDPGSAARSFREKDHGQSRARAADAFFRCVNDQLADGPVRFYAINGGNDLAGMFLTPAQALEARASLPRESDWPYLPEEEATWIRGLPASPVTRAASLYHCNRATLAHLPPLTAERR